MNPNAFAKIPAKLLQAPPNHLKLWHAIALHCIEHPTCFPGIPLLAKETGYCERQVRRLLKEMEMSGLIAKNHKNGRPAELEPLTPKEGLLYQQPRTRKSPVTDVPRDTEVLGTPDIPVRGPRTCTSAELELLNRTKKKEQEPPLPPKRGTRSTRAVHDPEKLTDILDAMDLSSFETKYGKEIDVQTVWQKFRNRVIGAGNPRSYVRFPQAFENWCLPELQKARERCPPETDSVREDFLRRPD